MKTMPLKNQPATRIRPQEVDFVRSCCLPSNLAANEKKARRKNFDWASMTNYAVYHGLASLFLRSLTKSSITSSNLQLINGDLSDLCAYWGIGHESLNILRGNYLSTMRNNLRIQTVLCELDNALAGTDITCILWKGAALIFDVYPGMGLRPMDDIDLLVPTKQIPPLKNLLLGLGFEPHPKYPLTWHRDAVVLDIHMDVVHGDRIAGRLNALPITAEKMAPEVRFLPHFHNIVTLSPRDTLICLAVHALKHGFSRDYWLIDTFYLLDHYSELIKQPAKLIQRSFDLQASLPLYLLFSILQTWPQHLDLQFIQHLRPAKLGFLARHFLKTFETGQRIPYVGELFYFFLINSYSQKIAFVIESVFPSRQVMHQLFPERHLLPYWCYYPLRIALLGVMLMETVKTLIQPVSLTKG